MQLLERDEALATMVAARNDAARGEGRVVFVTGEPGIGKTALVTRFVEDLGDGARVLLGTCDDLSIPRPLGPIRDLAGSVSEPLERALASGAPAHEVQALLLAELELEPQPTVLVLEDVHWADDATFDSIMVLGRRIATLPALLVLTMRSGEAPPGHPLHATIGAIRAEHSTILELAPLSESAVASLCGEDGRALYDATGGNPFYVTELLASRPADMTPSIANAVVGRASRLDPDARNVVELVSVVPNRVSTALLDTVLPSWPAAAEEPERRQLLEVAPSYVRFRHELARNAIRSSIPIAARRRLHAEILDALLAADADPADVVHHAEAAGAENVVADYALVAARRAAALDSNREAYSHYRRASHFLDRLAPAEQAGILEELAIAAYTVGRITEGMPAIERAIALYRGVGDAAAVGRCTRIQSRICWFGGEGELAREKGLEAVGILEPLGETIELARAYSAVSQLAMLAEDSRPALEWGDRALDLATRLGDDSTRAHALVNIGSARVQLAHDDIELLLEAHEVADAAGNREEAVRALNNLGYSLMCWADPVPAVEYSTRALAYAEEHEAHTYVSYVRTTLAWLRLRAGDWEEAERITQAELDRGIAVVQVLARTVLTELAVRRGDPDAAERLADATEHAEQAFELQRTVPVLELAAERALTCNTAMPTERLHKQFDDAVCRGSLGRFAVRLAAWAKVAGLEVDLGIDSTTPHGAMTRGDWRAAADGFGAVGWTYDRALMLSLLDDEDALVEAIEIARGLGAEPLTRRVANRMRDLGIRVPHGPRVATRANPAGLTARQLEVLALVAGGLTNAEIADRLVVSQRTAEHHVAAVLAKLGAPSRRDAARLASELGLEMRT